MEMKADPAENETAVVRRRYDRGAWRYDLTVWPMELMAVTRTRVPRLRGEGSRCHYHCAR
jgi:hypothetical protein